MTVHLLYFNLCFNTLSLYVIIEFRKMLPAVVCIVLKVVIYNKFCVRDRKKAPEVSYGNWMNSIAPTSVRLIYSPSGRFLLWNIRAVTRCNTSAVCVLRNPSTGSSLQTTFDTYEMFTFCFDTHQFLSLPFRIVLYVVTHKRSPSFIRRKRSGSIFFEDIWNKYIYSFDAI